MKKFLLSIFAMVLAFMPFSGLKAQAKSKTTKQAIPQKESSLLWKISGNGLEKPSYVFGTIHLICEKDFFFTPVMEDAFRKSEKVVMEMDMDDEGVQMKVAMGMINESGNSLSDYFEPNDYDQLKSYVAEKNMGMPFEAFAMMKPAAVWTTLIMSYYTCEDTKSYEVELMAKAKEQSKEIFGLETPQEQLDFILGMPEKEVVQGINDIVSGKDKKEIDQQFVDMIAAYKSQNLNKLLDITNKETAMKMNTDIFLDKRNIAWIPTMENMMKESTTFFAVGAAHLPGANGVLELLKKQGYTVETVR